MRADVCRLVGGLGLLVGQVRPVMQYPPQLALFGSAGAATTFAARHASVDCTVAAVFGVLA